MVTGTRNDAVFKAIADATRRSILEALDEGSLPVQAIAERFPSISRPAISKHLRILREAGLVEEEQQGRKRFYSLLANRLGQVDAWLARFLASRSAGRVRSAPKGGPAATSRQRPAGEDDWRVW